MKSIPALSAIWASARQSAQLADQRSGTLVAERPDEQFAPNMPILSALPLYIASRSRIDPLRLGTSSTLFSRRSGVRVLLSRRTLGRAAKGRGGGLQGDC